MLPLSATRVEAFRKCPLAFKLRYLDGEPEAFVSIEAFSGRVVHGVLEDLHSRVEEGEAPTLLQTLDRLERSWLEAFGKEPEVRVVRGGRHPRWWLKRAAGHVETYYWGHHPFPAPPEERREWELTFDLVEGVPVRGFVDRLVVRADGVVEIHDYKTGRHRPKRLELDTQVAIYQLGVRQHFPDRPVESVWHYLAREETARMSPPAEVLAESRERVLGVWEDIQAEEEWAPKPGRLCAWCGYLDRCPEGRATLR